MIRKAIIVVLTLAAVGTMLTLVGVKRWIDTNRPLGRSSLPLQLSNDPAVFVGFGCQGNRLFCPQLNLALTVELTENDVMPLTWRYEGYGVGGYLVTRDGFGWRNYTEAIHFPVWLPVIMFAAYPAIVLIHGPVRRYRRRKRGLCLTCGYNLTGNVSGVCSECGTEIKQPPEPPDAPSDATHV